ncbi:Protein of unknown function (DUF1353) [Bradyrhizobium sp. YR681]|uniref:DUF1353 domain-containing protein n=1 Tax=Bradyrhizobium sp. YR681 TaxID=1144344 RepID=UPI000270DEEB|nr:DUF1353 domain-containing protein [Bradyrhizobium sp. YR681]EJN15104.1 Protein of unknown function (DUF1353) [Bradyrhizobium sp. YR681]
MLFNRRETLALAAGSALGLSVAKTGSAQTAQSGQASTAVESWMDEWISSRQRASDDPLHVGRFKEPIYYLLRPISWQPGADAPARLEAVEAPAGFVTDFASIPQIFWSALRPDGEYTYPAIIHDYLYWTQTRPRAVADEIFRASMQDFNIAPKTITLIYEAVRLGGQSAWDGNAELKRKGERRFLKPDANPRARDSWIIWKERTDVFADADPPEATKK